jgi:hypothetical protein
MLEFQATGRAFHSVRAVVWPAKPGAHGVTRPTFAPLKKNTSMELILEA